MKTTIISSAFVFLFVNNVAGGVIREAVNALTRRDTFQWGSIGDSYASGVAYLASNAYDDNAGGCLRTTDAYANQLKNDESWMNGWTEYFNWAACSGSKLVDMQHQIVNTGSSPRLVTMTAGGNDAQFFNIADSCMFHSNRGADYGPDYNVDNARAGMCAKAIDASKSYIANTIGNDLKNTIDSILDADNVKSQPDFLLYVTGYAQFFNGNETWCNTHSFGVFSWPPLSQYLRNDMNDLVTQLNSVYQSTIQSYPSKNVRFISIDAGFKGHRFCEAGGSLWGQYFNSDVWFWNVVPPNLSITNQDADDAQIEQALDTSIGNATITPFSSGTGSVSDGWKLRPFHPKIGGHAAIEKAIVAQMKTDNIPPSPSAVSTPAATPSATQAPYATGTCSFHLDEWQDCAEDSQNLFAQITMYDNDKKIIGQTVVDPAKDPLGEPINTKDPYSFVSNLTQPMVVVGEHQNDYVQFTIGTLSWKSTDTTGPATCTVGGWDPRDGPVCLGKAGGQNAKNQMDCSFPC